MADYSYWANALKGEFGPIFDSEAFPGFYRKRTGKAAGYVPCAIWEQDGNLVALVDGQAADPSAVWSYVADKPISEAHYRERVETGKWWDEDSATTASLSPPPIGHNQGPTDPAEILSEQITAALAGVDAYAEVKDDETASKAQSLRSRLLELSREADGIRVKTKEPHLEAGRAVDTLYQPLVKNSKAGADTIAKALGAFETAKAREAAMVAKIAEDARKKALEEAQAKAPIGVTVEVEPAPVVAAAPARIAGSYGRAASVKPVKIATVANQDLAYAFLRLQPELVELIQKLAQKMVTTGMTVPGVEITEERRVV